MLNSLEQWKTQSLSWLSRHSFSLKFHFQMTLWKQNFRQQLAMDWFNCKTKSTCLHTTIIMPVNKSVFKNNIIITNKPFTVRDYIIYGSSLFKYMYLPYVAYIFWALVKVSWLPNEQSPSIEKEHILTCRVVKNSQYNHISIQSKTARKDLKTTLNRKNLLGTWNETKNKLQETCSRSIF